MTGGTTARVIALQKVSSPDYLRTVFAAWREHAVIAPTDTPETLTLPGMAVTDRVTVRPGGGWFDERIALDDDPAPAQISFTSGTTGTPKPVLLSRRALSDVTRRLNAIMAIDDTIREYVGVPVTFSFGLGRARAIAVAGGRAYLPPNGFRPDEFASMLADGEVNALSAVPTLLRLLIQQRDLFVSCGAKLRWVEIGSQYMSADEKEAVRAMFPNARIVQHYGLTEASRSTFLVVSETSGTALESVGRPESPDAIRIDDEGRIVVRGPHVADGIMTETGVTPFADADGWLTTSDLGAIDADGYVYFKGRADHLLNVSGIKVPAELFEQRLAEAHGDAHAIAVAGRRDPLRGEAVMVAHLAGVDAARLRERARGIAAGFGLGAADVSLVEVPEIPRTETGKVRRQILTELYSDAAPTTSARPAVPAAGAALSPREEEIAAIWRDVRGVPHIGRNETFFELGGDSLSV
ncbi:AMP-binding protein, partial [Sphingomonas sp.]|uniref:class I adenylate-forming enzyme family protein n=1 Tax=Sphingomonas sp. TaxID=28214 RepID=UPI003B3A1141